MADTQPPAGTDPGTTRRKRLLVIGSALALIGIGWGAYKFLSNDALVSTDDAYVNGHVVAVTPQVAGTVRAILADDTDRIQPGTTLVALDPSDMRIRLEAANAALGQAVRHVHQLFADVQEAQAVVAVRQTELDRATADLRARRMIVGQGAVTAEEARHAADTVNTATAALKAARDRYAVALSQTAGVTPATHPDILAAQARLRAAALDLERATIRAPVGGMIARRDVQLGRRVAVGERLMAIVPFDQFWIDANFKEGQLAHVCAGQSATMTADIYGSGVTYHGRVADVNAGSGAAFALLPAQNATGNWIKVVQRVPVRIVFDPSELERHPLRIGMSTDVTIDTSRCETGKTPREPSAAETSLYTAQSHTADEQVAAAMKTTLGDTE
ncbi:multidrug resistance efflux pump [Gluconacetobacter sacchari DSM 12717]|uniref:HlyD family efflux transporter periplasmic adaptor subunit n=2 Tax=Gluconacetobacter sacchari TaxID=92759 RepID=A0A7W4NTY7_9PROT|nr:HlyD family efflux transporter periplasmic adaptor subunit [Gluconacetobacter sacchari]MBB2162780.1 HlyD family efflux transporter periplasmic adaptor subunit [Gluconacetobacter sacchari]GBQ25531.1 multidrug resistance efflux pump [Gluconacetobacter sacchari DSM 12717]